MTSLLSFSLNCYPLYNHSKTLIQGVPARRLVARRLQSPSTGTKEVQLKWSNGLNRGIFAANRSYFSMMTLSRNFYVPFSNHMIVISGFWVGPDSDDGWGFVDALVYHI